MSVRYYVGFGWDKNECDRWVYRWLLYNVMERYRRGFGSLDWGLGYLEELFVVGDVWKNREFIFFVNVGRVFFVCVFRFLGVSGFYERLFIGFFFVLDFVV